MAVVTTRVVVYRSAVARFMNTDAKSWARGFARDIKTLAIATSPSRTGEMRARHYYRVRSRGMNITAEVGNRAPYARYVHEGTHGPIRARQLGPVRPGGNRSRNMVFFSRNQLWRVREVSGQRAQPWIWNATRDVARRYGVG